MEPTEQLGGSEAAVRAQLAETQRTLAETQRMLRDLQRVAGIGTWEWTVADGRITWSEEMYRIAGLPVGEPMDLARYGTLHHPEDAELVRSVVDRALVTGEPYSMKHRLIRPDGSARWVEGRGVVERDAAGRPTRVFGTAQDITEREEARQREALLRQEREARSAAERSAKRLQFVAEASAVLAGSLDYESTLRNVAELAVPGVADWCAVDLLEDGRLTRVAVQHSNPEHIEAVYSLDAEYPPQMDAPNGAAAVVRSGQTEWMREIPAELLSGIAQDARHLELIERLGLRSYIAAPLKARDRTLGVMSFVQAESGRLFEDADVAFIEDLARRAAVAIDNALLVQNLEEVQARLEEQSAELEMQAAELEMQTEQLELETRRTQDVLQDLAAERTRLAAIIDNAPVGFIIAEAPSGRIVLGNRTAEEMLRHPVLHSGAVDEYDQWVSFHADGRQVTAEEYPLAISLRTGRKAGPLDVHYQRGDGTRFWMRITGAPLLDEHGDVTGALVVMDDIDAEYRADSEREALLAQVSAEQQLLRQVFEKAPAVMALLSGPDQVVSLVNPTWEETVGKAGALGLPFREVFPEFEPTGLFEQLARTYESGEPYVNPETSVPLLRWDGTVAEDTVWNLVWLPMPWREDGTRDVLVHAVEITQQVRAREQVRSLAEATLALQSAATVADALQEVANHARSIIGTHYAEASVRGSSGEAIETIAQAGTRAERVDAGEWLSAELRAYGGEPIGGIRVHARYHGTFTPEDRAVLVQLAQLASATLENKRLFERAVEASRAKSDFLATMSHELRTPLNAMIGYSELLELGVPERIPDASRAQVERIRLAAQHLLQLIEEILTFSRMDAGRERLDIQAVPLDTLVQEVRAIIEPLVAQKQLDFTVDIREPGVQLETDPRKVRQILLNLIGNAVKFTNEGTVAFSAHVDRDFIVLNVRDTGIGIAAEHIESIFEPFWQAETSMHTRAGGTGLGLPLTRKFIELLGGELHVQSEPGAGSEFVARLPLRSTRAD